LREERRVRLRYVGDGPDRASLEQSVKEKGLEKNIVFEGAVNQDNIRELYSRADAFVLASFAEGIPVVLMEAMAMEIPCITTRIAGIPELIRDGADGLLVPASDVEALKNAIASLMNDSSLRLKLGRAGRQRVIEKYNLKPNADRLAEIFRRRLSGQTSEFVMEENESHDDAKAESKTLSGVKC
jgi:glycosyltransferase involved in cell wall biosynthesis